MYAIIDVETTGGSPSVDRIIEIAIVVYDGESVVTEYATLVNPQRPIDKYVTQLTGITDRMVRDAPLWEHIQAQVLDLTADRIFVAHNVKFDYGMLRGEFKRLGHDYIRKQLDTVTLARKVLPGFTSYSLGSLCDSLGIVIENRHRALGDAQATVKLLDIILKQSSSKKHIEIELNHGIDPSILPPNISIGEIEKLPEEPGVFYLKDSNDQVLFIDAAKNVRKEVIKFFNRGDSVAERPATNDAITQIDYVAAGNELVARLQAYHEARKWQPLMNKKPKEYKFSHGIFLIPDEDGFLHPRVEKIDYDGGELALRFQGKGTAHKVLAKIVAEGHLQVQFSLLRKITEPEQRENFKKSYNEKVAKAVHRYLYRHTSFFILGDGRRPDETSVVWIEHSTYRGIGYISPEIAPINTQNLMECIALREEDVEIQKIIRQELRKAKGLKLVTY